MDQKDIQQIVVSIKRLHKWYRNDGLEFHALDDVSLEIRKGEFVAIVGPSGSGKSTLMNIIGCLDGYTEGEYYLSGQDVKALEDKQLAKFRGKIIGFVFQSFNLLEKYTVLENVMLPSLYVTIPQAKERAIELLTLLEIEDKAHNLPSQISGGQKQRVAIARALMADPDLLLADEPTGNLDSKTGKLVLEIFEKLRGMGKTVLLITHDPVIASHAQRQIKILDGRVE